MEANSSQCPLLGEDQIRETDNNVRDDRHTAPTTPDGSPSSSRTTDQPSVREEMEEFDASTQETSFWYRRRTRNDNSPTGISREDTAAWSLFTRDVDSVAPSEPEIVFDPVSYWDLRKLNTFIMWQLEVFSLVISMASFAGIVVLLAMYDGKPQPGFASRISINALIAIFSTVLKATLLFVVSEVMGQLKWKWIETPRPVRDIEYFINAGAGLGGSLKFLFFTWKPILAILGAVIVIASAAIGPFSQQSSATYPCDELDSSSIAKVNISHIIEGEMAPEMRGIATKGLVFGGSDTSAACDTGNCTFASYESIGICSSCYHAADDTKSFDENESDLTVGWPSSTDGFNSSYALRMKTAFQPMWEPENSNSTTERRVTEALLGVNTTISTIMITTNNDTPNSVTERPAHDLNEHLRILAVDCTMYPCVRNYSGRVKNGNFRELVTHQTPLPLVSRMEYRNNTPYEYYGDFVEFTDPCFFKNQWWTASNITMASSYQHKTPTADDNAFNQLTWRLNGKMAKIPTKCSRMISAETYGSIQKFIDTNIKASCSVSGTDDDLKRGLKTVDCGDKWWINSVFNDGQASLTSVDAAFDDMATAITSLIRVNGLSYDRKPHAYAYGSINQGAVCIKASWPWLIYPGSLLVLTMALFMTTYVTSMMERRERPVWKSSVLPLIFYYIKSEGANLRDTDAGGNKQVCLLQLLELEEVAKNTIVRFDNDTDAPGFVAEEGEKGPSNNVP
ncbi:hypothetical protein CkaCkLH20_03963 [Colletotrichum karsti]|uniref:Uncharacterized protein n=1 Tax=Colletotrichum karsti TaxID=1095194 RepID=A0A9P6IB05_9PEZI|nr:uncharacterized protein CkaCkLH20_03963 [Colletotrichum karsti]KAF9878471.1 hypothetical protein CkaCkLH20_03963 [Colletotrichum karsti]